MYLENILNKEDYFCPSDVSRLKFKKITYKPSDVDSESIYFHLGSTTHVMRNFKEAPAAAVIDEDADQYSDCAFPVLAVKNIRRLLAFAYFRFYNVDTCGLKFVGVTGTNGKTTTAYMIKSILNAEGRITGFIGTGKIESNGKLLSDYDYSMTTPDPDILYSALDRMKKDGCEYIVMEVSSHALALEKLAPITFDVSVFTNLSHEHLDFHKNMQSYYRAKMRLFEQSRLGIFNIDDAYVRRAFAECDCKKTSVGILWCADTVAGEPVLRGLSGSSYLYRARDFIFRMNLPLAGAYNIYNSLCAITAAVALGCRPCVAKHTLEALSSPDGRFEVIESDITVIIDYAHTPAAMENTLKTAKSCKNAEQKLICVFGCGGARDKAKRPIMGRIAESLSDFTIITEDNSRTEDSEAIINGILSGISNRSRISVIPSRKAAIEAAILNAPVASVIAILGKGAEKYNIDKNGTHPFDERKIISEAIEKRKQSKRNEGKS